MPRAATPSLFMARTVGQRHGCLVLFEVAAGELHRAGHAFCQADNGVWLTDAVPPEYLRLLAADAK